MHRIPTTQNRGHVVETNVQTARPRTESRSRAAHHRHEIPRPLLTQKYKFFQQKSFTLSCIKLLLCFVFSKVRNTKCKTSLHKTQCPNGDKLKAKIVNKNRTIAQVYSHRHFFRFYFMSPSRRLTTQDTKHKSQNTKLESQKFETQNSKHESQKFETQNSKLPYTKHIVPMGTS